MRKRASSLLPSEKVGDVEKPSRVEASIVTTVTVDVRGSSTALGEKLMSQRLTVNA